MRREVWVDLFNNLRHNAYVLLWTHLIPPTIKFGRRLNRLKLAVFAFLKKRHFEFTIHVKWLFIIAFLGILAFPSHSTPISLPQQPYSVPKALKPLEMPNLSPQSQVASVYVAPAPVVITGGNLSAILLAIRPCESSNNYTAQNPTSSASGAFQIIISTWADYGGYSQAKYAPPAVQDAKALLLYQADGTRPWVSSEGCWGG